MWAHRLGDQRAKRLLLTGDCITGAQAAEWGLAVEAPDPTDLDERTERLVERIAAVPVNQLIMVKLAMNSALYNQGVANSAMIIDDLRRHRPTHPEGHAFVAQSREHGFRRRSASATNRSATTAGRRPGSSDVDAFADDGPFRRAERAARRAPGLGHCERTHQAHSRFRHQRADGPGGTDADGQRRRPGPLRGRLPALRPAAGRCQRRQDDAINPRLRKWDGTWTTLVITSVGTDARTRAALRTTLQDKRFGELREGVWLRPRQPRRGADGRGARAGAGTARPRRRARELAARLWTCRAGYASAAELLDEIATATDIPGRFVAAAGMVRHLLTDPVLPDELLPDRLARRRIAAGLHELRRGTGRAARRCRTDGGNVTSGGVRVERSGPVTTVIMNRPEARNAVNGPAAAELYEAFDEFDKDDVGMPSPCCGATTEHSVPAPISRRSARRMPTRCIAPGPVRWGRAGWCCQAGDRRRQRITRSRVVWSWRCGAICASSRRTR